MSHREMTHGIEIATYEHGISKTLNFLMKKKKNINSIAKN